MTKTQTGTLYLIVGPSGAGKDTLITAARDHLSQTHVFPKRTITRPIQSPEEDHIVATVDSFTTQMQADHFALTWSAHGLYYGIPNSILDDIKRGKHVVANVSRELIEQAKRTFHPVQVILVTAPIQILATRLKSRGREAPSDITGRLTRQTEVTANTTIVNDGSIETALNKFILALQS